VCQGGRELRNAVLVLWISSFRVRDANQELARYGSCRACNYLDLSAFNHFPDKYDDGNDSKDKRELMATGTAPFLPLIGTRCMQIVARTSPVPCAYEE
jgi:hypothetical protein